MFFFIYISVFFFKQKTAYEQRISDWSSDVCSSDLLELMIRPFAPGELSNHRMPEWPILLTHSNMSRWSDLTSCTLHDFYRSRRAIDPLLALRHDSCLTFQCW